MTTTSHSGNPHRDRALNHLEASLAARDALSDLYARGAEAPRHRIAHLHDEVRLGVKLAQVHAILAVEARMAALTPDVIATLGLGRVTAGAKR